MGRGASSAAGVSSFGAGALSATGASGAGADGRDCRGSRRFVAFIAACFLVRLARGIVRVRIVHVVRNVLSVVLTQLDGYVFID